SSVTQDHRTQRYGPAPMMLMHPPSAEQPYSPRLPVRPSGKRAPPPAERMAVPGLYWKGWGNITRRRPKSRGLFPASRRRRRRGNRILQSLPVPRLLPCPCPCPCPCPNGDFIALQPPTPPLQGNECNAMQRIGHGHGQGHGRGKESKSVAT